MDERGILMLATRASRLGKLIIFLVMHPNRYVGAPGAVAAGMDSRLRRNDRT